MRQYRGWIYRDTAVGVTPACLRVTIRLDQSPPLTNIFNDSPKGSEEAAEFITSMVGDNWKLEECGFLGYRIVVS